MARKEPATGNLLASLSRASPLLAEASPLLAEASTPAAGLPGLDQLRTDPKAAGKLPDDLSVANELGRNASVVAGAAPDVAVLAPAAAIAGSVAR